MALQDNEKPLIISNWQDGMADSPELGFGLIMRADIEAFPGAVKVKNKSLGASQLVTAQTFTVDPATDIASAAGSMRTQIEQDNGNNFYYAAVTFSTSNTLPAPLVAGTVYFLIYLSDTTFKIATSWTNADTNTPIDITTTGTGVHTVTAVPMARINYGVADPRTNYKFAIDDNGRVWNTRGGSTFYYLAGNTITAANGNGLALFGTSDGNHTWLFVFRNKAIDVIDVWGDTNLNAPVWNTAWQNNNSGAGSGDQHHAIVGQDNIVYFTNDHFVGSIVEKAGQVFDPTNGATYTYNASALTLPQYEKAYWLAELGINLLTAGNTFNKVYPWDRVSNSYNLPLLVPENNIVRLINLGNIVYIFAGFKGNIYYTQGTYVKFFKKVPAYLYNNNNSIQSNPMSWGGVAIVPNAIVFGLTANGGGTVYGGVYKIYQDGRLVIDQQSAYAPAANGARTIIAQNDFYIFGYDLGSGSGGLDYADASQYSNFETILHSALFKVGDKTHKTGYSDLEVQIAQNPSGTGHIRVSYRTATNASWTALATYSVDATTTSFQTDIGLTDLENIQIQVELDGQIELLEVRLTP
jgi:hypothetical protein